MDQTDMLIIAGGDGTLQEVQKYLHKVGLFKKYYWQFDHI